MMASAPAGEKPVTLYDLLGGDETIRAIVDRFYDLMDSDPAYAELRAMHAPDLGPMRHLLTRFLAGWSGGPRDWFDSNPGRCMMSVHKPYAISHALAGQWAEAMQRAIADAGPEDKELGRQMSEVLGQMARGMGR